MTANSVSMLREVRKQAGLTQKQLAERYQIPLRTLQDWETGKRTPPEYVLNMLLRCIAVDFKIKPKDVRYIDEKFTLTYLDGSRLSDIDNAYARSETKARRVREITRDGVHQCEGGFLFKATRNYGYTGEV